MASPTTAAATEVNARKGRYVVSQTFTSVAAADEVTLTGLPTEGRIHGFKWRLSSGSATRLDPVLAQEASGVDAKAILEYDPADAALTKDNLVPMVPLPYRVAIGGALYLKLKPNAGTDNAVFVELFVSEGW